MTFRVIHQPSPNKARCPYRVVVKTTGREISWINQYLDYETLRRLTDNTLRSYAHELLHFLRWWESVHHTDLVTKDSLTESTLLDYVRFQSGLPRPLSGGTINQRVAIADKALRHLFPKCPSTDCSRIPAVLLATCTNGDRTAAARLEPLAREDPETSHSATVGG
jgi:hypothetical protein